MKKPIVGFIAGVTAPPGKRMGHAGALISGGADTADAKLAVMEECGFTVTRNPSEMGKPAERLAVAAGPNRTAPGGRKTRACASNEPSGERHRVNRRSQSPEFWIALSQIIGINIVLSGRQRGRDRAGRALAAAASSRSRP